MGPSEILGFSNFDINGNFPSPRPASVILLSFVGWQQWCRAAREVPQPLLCPSLTKSTCSCWGLPGWKVLISKEENITEYLSNKTIKDGDIAPWKDLEKLNKDKRKEQRNNYILIWAGSSSVFFMWAFALSPLRPCICSI